MPPRGKTYRSDFSYLIFIHLSVLPRVTHVWPIWSFLFDQRWQLVKVYRIWNSSLYVRFAMYFYTVTQIDQITQQNTYAFWHHKPISYMFRHYCSSSGIPLESFRRQIINSSFPGTTVVTSTEQWRIILCYVLSQ